PDERMSDFMIDWIAEFSKKYGYKPGGAFISSKPKTGFNHKEFGVTSYGVNVCLHQVLLELGINPEQDRFTIKMSGGPDGDVAGNQIKNLYRFYPDTAKLIALTDVSGTIYDPEGLDLKTLVELFEEVKPIRCYPPELLHPGGVLLDREIKQQMTSLITHTLCWENHEGELIKKWIAGSEMNHLFRHNVHQRPADVFVPAGGRPRTISISNIGDFLDETGKPTAKAIVEGANLYVTEHARKALESKGVLIIKDSSANKGGVICSSFEVLTSLVVDEEKFLDVKQALIQEILEHIKKCTFNESRTLLGTHRRTGRPMTEISDEISKKINLYTYQILDHLQGVELSSDPEDPLNLCFLTYCLPTLRHRFQKELIDEVPDQHKKAIIACHVASQIVYCRGIDWSPSIVDVLPNIWRDPTIVTECILYDQ
ncbi:MAG: glutamate dehydrogenase, partial [Chlamydiia bacterium]|nr:glutamate dehydrogenase [Chlamydiia bacterium]